MKLNKLLTIAYIGIATISTSSVVNAMDAEFAAYNHAKAQIKGSQYKKELAVEKRLRHGGGAPISLGQAAAIDTLELLQSIDGTAGKLDAVKGRFAVALKAKAVAFLDHADIAAAGDASVVFAATALGHADGTRGQLKALVDAAINVAAAPYAAIVAPVDGDVETLSAKKSEMLRVMTAQVNTALDVLGADDTVAVLTQPVANLLGAVEADPLVVAAYNAGVAGAAVAASVNPNVALAAAYDAGVAGGAVPAGAAVGALAANAAAQAAYDDAVAGTPITNAQVADAPLEAAYELGVAALAAHNLGIAAEAARGDGQAGNAPAYAIGTTRGDLKAAIAAALG